MYSGYHEDCIKQWLNEKISCPNCNTPISAVWKEQAPTNDLGGEPPLAAADEEDREEEEAVD